VRSNQLLHLYMTLFIILYTVHVRVNLKSIEFSQLNVDDKKEKDCNCRPWEMELYYFVWHKDEMAEKPVSLLLYCRNWPELCGTKMHWISRSGKPVSLLLCCRTMNTEGETYKVAYCTTFNIARRIVRQLTLSMLY